MSDTTLPQLDSLVASINQTSSKKRGRPRKNSPDCPPISYIKKRRGRPRKSPSTSPSRSRKRGRPRKRQSISPNLKTGRFRIRSRSRSKSRSRSRSRSKSRSRSRSRSRSKSRSRSRSRSLSPLPGMSISNPFLRKISDNELLYESSPHSLKIKLKDGKFKTNKLNSQQCRLLTSHCAKRHPTRRDLKPQRVTLTIGQMKR